MAVRTDEPTEDGMAGTRKDLTPEQAAHALRTVVQSGKIYLARAERLRETATAHPDLYQGVDWQADVANLMLHAKENAGIAVRLNDRYELGYDIPPALRSVAQ